MPTPFSLSDWFHTGNKVTVNFFFFLILRRPICSAYTHPPSPSTTQPKPKTGKRKEKPSGRPQPPPCSPFDFPDPFLPSSPPRLPFLFCFLLFFSCGFLAVSVDLFTKNSTLTKTRRNPPSHVRPQIIFPARLPPSRSVDQALTRLVRTH